MESKQPLRWRRIMLSERYHHLLCHVLESGLMLGIFGEPTRRLLTTIKRAKIVEWDEPIQSEEYSAPGP